MQVVGVENKKENRNQKPIFSDGMKRVRGWMNSFSSAWKRDALEAAEIDRLRQLERSKVFERDPWLGWRF